jgi:hypothetical protein
MEPYNFSDVSVDPTRALNVRDRLIKGPADQRKRRWRRVRKKAKTVSATRAATSTADAAPLNRVLELGQTSCCCIYHRAQEAVTSRTKPLAEKDLSLAPPELAFASHAFKLAWTKIDYEYVARPDAAHAARDLLARAVLSHIRHPLGEPEVIASRALRTFRDILPIPTLHRDLQRESRGARDLDPSVLACQEAAVLLWQSRTLIDGIIARQRITRSLIERALALIAEQQRPI